MRKKILFVILILPITLVAQTNIWENTNCRAKVQLTPYLAEGDNNTAIIVCPGGSYFWHDTDTEGHLVAQWLRDNHISAFVLRYRTAGVVAFVTHYRYIARGRRYPDAQDDLLRAIVYLKAHANEFGISCSRIGVVGFSAGGHLAMSAGEFFPSEFRPSFIASIYPVVTMSEDCVHKRSRRALLGDGRKNNLILRDSLSLERHVPEDCPPVFIVNCKDDPIVDYHNSELLDSALIAKGIPHKYIQYQFGGHGFGASDTKGNALCRTWRDEFLSWLSSLNLR